MSSFRVDDGADDVVRIVIRSSLPTLKESLTEWKNGKLTEMEVTLGPFLRVVEAFVNNTNNSSYGEYGGMSYDLFADRSMLEAIFEVIDGHEGDDNEVEDLIDQLFISAHGRRARRMRRLPLSEESRERATFWLNRLRSSRPRLCNSIVSKINCAHAEAWDRAGQMRESKRA